MTYTNDDKVVLQEIRERLNELLDGQTQLQTDMGEVKTDVAGLKSNMKKVKADINFLKQATVAQFSDVNNHEARLKRLEKVPA